MLTSKGRLADTDAMAISRSRTTAGGYADGRYRRGLASWRRRSDPILAAVFGPFLIGGFVVLILEQQLLSWSAGVIFGLLMGVGIALRESPPRYVEQWRDGAEGERKTANALKRLEKRGWTVVHDVKQRYGNYDHIAVGPHGVYLLESKNLEGIVEIKNGVPQVNRRHDPEAQRTIGQIRSQALGEAVSVKQAIQQRTGHRLWVHAVVVFWSEFPEQLVEADPCVYIHGSRLRSWLSERPATLKAEQVGEIATAIRRLAEG